MTNDEITVMATDTSAYLFEMGEFQKDDDEKSLTVVWYRESRPAEITVIFKPSEPGSPFCLFSLPIFFKEVASRP